MVDTPKEGDGDKATEDNPPKKQSKHRRQRRRSKPRHSKNSDTGTGEEKPNGAEQEYDPDQPTFEQAEQEHGLASPDEHATGGYLDSSPATGFEPPASVSIESDWAPIMEFSSTDIF